MKPINLQNLETFYGEIKKRYARQSALEALQTRIGALEQIGSEANLLEGVMVNGTALAIADKMVDILIASGAENGTISVNGVDVAIAGLQALAYKANVSETDLDTALAAVIAAKAEAAAVDALTLRVAASEGKLGTLIGSVEGDEAKSVRAISAEEVARIVADAPEAYDTLKELADWLAGHETDAAAMNSAIQTNAADIRKLATLVGTLPETAASTDVVSYIAEAIAAIGIGDYAKTTEVTDAITTALGSYYTKTEVDAALAGYVKTSDIETISEEEILALFAEEDAE